MFPVRAYFTDFDKPAASCTISINMFFHGPSRLHLIHEPKQFFGDNHDGINMTRVRVGSTTYLVFHTDELVYTIVGPNVVHTGRALVVREGVKAPYRAVSLRKDIMAALTAAKR